MTDHPVNQAHRDNRTFGERCADHLRNGMGTWGFIFGALAFLAIWMCVNGALADSAFDPFPYILLNLTLSCLAALQGAILLIAAKRSDKISADLAEHDYRTNVKAEQEIRELGELLRGQTEELRLLRQLVEASHA